MCARASLCCFILLITFKSFWDHEVRTLFQFGLQLNYYLIFKEINILFSKKCTKLIKSNS